MTTDRLPSDYEASMRKAAPPPELVEDRHHGGTTIEERETRFYVAGSLCFLVGTIINMLK